MKSLYLKELYDLKSIDEIKKLYEKITKDNLPIDILVNNAGITDDSLFIRMNFEKWDNVIQTNLNSNFMLTNLFSKIMIKNGGVEL